MNRRDFAKLLVALGITPARFARALPRGSVSAGASPGTAGNWTARSTAAGVLWSHDFSLSANELNYFWECTTDLPNGVNVTNPSATSLQNVPNPLTLVSTNLGSSMAIRSKTVNVQVTGYYDPGTMTTSTTIPSGATYMQSGWPTQQWWQVASLADLPDPTTLNPDNPGYQLLIGASNAGGNGAIVESVLVTQIDSANSRIYVSRAQVNSSSSSPYGTAGAAYSYDLTAITVIGTIPPPGRWKRPFACFPGSTNGKGVDDLGITNALAPYGTGNTFPTGRTWVGNTQDSNANANFLEGYYGSPSYFGVGMPYQNWTPTVGSDRSTRNNCGDGSQLYFTFRAKISASRLDPANVPGGVANSTASTGKMLYIQNSAVSEPQQIFWNTGPQKHEEYPYPSLLGIGATVFGTYFLPSINYGEATYSNGGDSLADGGNLINGQTNGVQFQTDFGAPVWEGSSTPVACFVWLSDVWITFLVRLAPGTEGGSDGGIDISIALPGFPSWQRICNGSTWKEVFGSSSATEGVYDYDPPGINSMQLTEYPNPYVGSSSIMPALATQWVDFTQVIAAQTEPAVPDDTPAYLS